jgi:hypothetical protein
MQGAIRAYCTGRLWDKARALAGANPTFSRYVEDQYNTFLLANQQADELAARGGAHAQQVCVWGGRRSRLVAPALRAVRPPTFTWPITS